jgi:fructokinase
MNHLILSFSEIFRLGNDPDFIINPGVAYDFIEVTNQLIEAASNADCLYFGTLSQRSKISRETLMYLLKQNTKLKFLDINLRKDCYSIETITYSLVLC